MGIKPIRPFSPVQWLLPLGIMIAMPILLPLMMSARACGGSQADLSSQKEWMEIAAAYFPNRNEALERGGRIMDGCMTTGSVSYSVGDPVILMGQSGKDSNGMELSWEGVLIRVKVEPPPSTPIRINDFKVCLYGKLNNVDFMGKSIEVTVAPGDYQVLSVKGSR